MFNRACVPTGSVSHGKTEQSSRSPLPSYAAKKEISDHREKRTPEALDGVTSAGSGSFRRRLHVTFTGALMVSSAVASVMREWILLSIYTFFLFVTEVLCLSCLFCCHVLRNRVQPVVCGVRRLGRGGKVGDALREGRDHAGSPPKISFPFCTSIFAEPFQLPVLITLPYFNEKRSHPWKEIEK